MKLTSSIKLNLAEKLKNKSYFNEFFLARTRDEIAQEIRDLRSRRAFTQSELAAKAKMKQSAVSRIEQADYAGWNFKTLVRIAQALEARLVIRFVPMEDVIREYEEKETQSEQEDNPFNGIWKYALVPEKPRTPSSSASNAAYEFKVNRHENIANTESSLRMALPAEQKSQTSTRLAFGRSAEEPLSVSQVS